MKKFKKLFFGIGTVASVVAPVTAVVSCGAEISEVIGEDGKSTGQGVAWNRSEKTVYLNLFDTASPAPFKSFAPVRDGKPEPSINALEIARRFEKAAGYAVDTQYEQDNPGGVEKLHDGDIVKVHLACSTEYMEPRNDLHTTLQQRRGAFSIEYTFPFHELKDMKYNGSDHNTPLTPKLKAFYASYNPYGIHTNFLKAFLVAFSADTTKGFTIKAASGSNAAETFSKMSGTSIIASNSTITNDSGMSIWLKNVSIKNDKEPATKLKELWGNGKKTLVLHDEWVN